VSHVGLEAEGFGPVDGLEQGNISRQLCMPPQQISPSAARRSPCALATLHASLKVSAISLVLPEGSFNHSDGLAAESMRTIP